jgi:hypothetical protein
MKLPLECWDASGPALIKALAIGWALCGDFVTTACNFCSCGVLLLLEEGGAMRLKLLEEVRSELSREAVVRGERSPVPDCMEFRREPEGVADSPSESSAGHDAFAGVLLPCCVHTLVVPRCTFRQVSCGTLLRSGSFLVAPTCALLALAPCGRPRISE